jgi:hypothetical protein
MCRPKEPITVDELMGKSQPERTDEEIAEDIVSKFSLMAVRPGVPMANNFIR